MKEDRKEIPFLKAARVGNFKLWRSKYALAKGKDKTTIDCIHVSTLDGSWMTRIPSTWEMYGHMMLAYNDTFSEDPKVKESCEAFLSTVCSNMLYVSCIGNGYYQQSVQMIASLYGDPSRLKEKKSLKALKKDAEALIKDFLQWREQYDKELEMHKPTDEEMHQDELAEEALELLSKEEGQSS